MVRLLNHTNGQSVSQYVLASSPPWDLRPDLVTEVLNMWEVSMGGSHN
jgi:hypothetical protein